MKIQIDTTAKVITLQEDSNLKELFDFIKQLLPDSWQTYKLKIGTKIEYKESQPYPKWDDIFKKQIQKPIQKPMLINNYPQSQGSIACL